MRENSKIDLSKCLHYFSDTIFPYFLDHCPIAGKHYRTIVRSNHLHKWIVLPLFCRSTSRKRRSCHFPSKVMARQSSQWKRYKYVRFIALLKNKKYSWSQSRTSFFHSTVGDSCPAETLYESKFEGEWGEIKSKMIPRPDIIDVIFSF